MVAWLKVLEIQFTGALCRKKRQTVLWLALPAPVFNLVVVAELSPGEAFFAQRYPSGDAHCLCMFTPGRLRGPKVVKQVKLWKVSDAELAQGHRSPWVITRRGPCLRAKLSVPNDVRSPPVHNEESNKKVSVILWF